MPTRPEGPVRRTAKYSFRPAWTWPEDIEAWFHQQLGRLTAMPERPVIHVCSGSSRVGEVLVDMHHEGANVRGDAFRLPFRTSSLGTLVTDPPYPWGPDKRMAFGNELARVAKPGALLLWNAPWLPAEGQWWYEELVVANRRVGMPSDARILLRARRRETPAPLHTPPSRGRRRRADGPQ